MLYLANPTGNLAVREAMSAGELGVIRTPVQGNRRPPGALWAADNGCFGRGYPGDAEWLAWLRRHVADIPDCLFATAPDVVGDAVATLERSAPFLDVVRGIGYPVAFVGQDGLEDLDVPWTEFDVLFLGGSTEWKLGPAAAELTAQAVSRGMHVHMGRVNSYKRLRYAADIGCRSADGTFLRFAPTENLERVRVWLSRMET